MTQTEGINQHPTEIQEVSSGTTIRQTANQAAEEPIIGTEEVADRRINVVDQGFDHHEYQDQSRDDYFNYKNSQRRG